MVCRTMPGIESVGVVWVWVSHSVCIRTYVCVCVCVHVCVCIALYEKRPDAVAVPFTIPFSPG